MNEDEVTLQDIQSLSLPSTDPDELLSFIVASKYFALEGYVGSTPDDILNHTNRQRLTMKTAVLDTGMVTTHPLIKPKLMKSVNFSDEPDVEDRNGHGTLCTLVVLQSFHHIFERAYRVPLVIDYELYNVKVLNSRGGCKKVNMIRAINWCAKNDIYLINLSAGMFNESCKGDCELCVEARNATTSFIVAASGNQGFLKTTCPAKAGLYGTENVLARGALDPLTGEIATYSMSIFLF
jgi:subtilisin family serine protease